MPHASNPKPEIRTEPGAAPAFVSPFMAQRAQIGIALLSFLADKKNAGSTTLESVLALRSRFPIAACFNVHTFCNEACVMCPYDTVYAEKEHGVMPIDDFVVYIDDFVASGGRIITFNNFSDIFAHRLGVEYVEHAVRAHGKDAQIYLTTNGVGLRPERADRVLAAGFDGIVYASCHAFTPETFFKVTKRKSFDLVKENITYMIRNHPHPDRVVIQYATDYSSTEEIHAAHRYWSSLGATLNIFPTHTFADNSMHRKDGSRVGRLFGCRGWGGDAGQPFYQIVVQHNGDVSLCCHDLTASVVLGNVKRNGVTAAWNSEEFHKIIDDLYLGKSADPDFICRKCSLALVSND